VLYVALTRAIHSLHIVISPANTQKLPRTMAGLMRAALVGDGPLAPDSILFECGDPQSLAPDSTEEQESKVVLASAAVAERPLRLATTRRSSRSLERISPSGLEGGTRVRIRSWLEAASSGGQLRGSIMHALLAQIQWIEDDPPGDQQLVRAIADVMRDAGQTVDCAGWLAEFQRVLQQPLLRAQLSRELYKQPASLGFPASVSREIQNGVIRLVVENERPFAVRHADDLLSGSMDRLVLLYSGTRLLAADIIDFKTDALSVETPAAIEKKIEFYRPQMMAYRLAVGQLTGLAPDRIVARLLFLASGSAVPIS
jgi:ATP-dependent exoDNAse (exonuclease V) beta subunit